MRHDWEQAVGKVIGNQRNSLSARGAYLAMCSFLEMEEMLCNLALSSQGRPAGSTIWPDWLRCVERAKAGEVNANLILVKKT
jgi:hypothetical protein